MRIRSFWTGGSDFAVEGSWRWIETGGVVGPYVNWGPGQPDGNDTANCMVLTWFNSTLGWADAQCSPRSHHGHHSGNHYICEKSASSFVTP
uniref:C-type lectin domain-containing protein n=1 Tax=Pinctada fucata TaxID=50426 RepID=A0A194ANW5_PINFU